MKFLPPSNFQRVLGRLTRRAVQCCGGVTASQASCLFWEGVTRPAGRSAHAPGSPRPAHSCPLVRPWSRTVADCGLQCKAPRRGLNGITRHAYLPSLGIRGGSFSTSIALSFGIWKYLSEVFTSLQRVVTSEFLKYFHDLFLGFFFFFFYCYLKRGRKVNGSV